MKILHYSLGFPPYRTGGLTKFCVDLMKEQVKEGDDVSLLWPGKMQLTNENTKIIKRKSIDGINSFELINPTPIPYDEGINQIDAFMAEGSKEVYVDFLNQNKPDVIHIHTFMGIHKNFLMAAKELGIRTVYTTHDFYLICPKVTLFRDDMVCPDAKTCNSCAKCNTSALSLRKIRMLQMPLYRTLKDSYLVKKLRKRHRDNFLSEAVTAEKYDGCVENYKKLRNYNYEMYELIDYVQFNSALTKQVYDSFFGEKTGKVIPITHGDIQNHKKIKEFGEKLRITYLGNQSVAKGYNLLKDTLDNLYRAGHDIELNIFFTPKEKSNYMHIHERYNYSQLNQIFDETDVMIAPSVLYDTFGYTVLEAISYGVPVIVSDHVGAKDIVKDGTGLVFHSKEELNQMLISLDAKKLQMMNKKIFDCSDIYMEPDLAMKIKGECYSH